MIKQIGDHMIRSSKLQHEDINFLENYYSTNGKFPCFKQVLVETRTDCNNRCPFCPQTFNKKNLGVMNWNCYTAIIDQLAELSFSGRVALFLSNEPLLEDRLEDMIVYAKRKSPRFFLDITTNARLLTVEKLDSLFKFGLDNILINDYRNDREDYPEKISPNLEPIVNAYKNNPKVFIKKRSLQEKLPNYAGNIPQEFDSKDFGFCNYPFRKLTIAYTGDILLCCNDFMYNTFFGNVMINSLVDCWNNPEMNEIRLNLLKNRRVGFCKRCNEVQNYSVF